MMPNYTPVLGVEPPEGNTNLQYSRPDALNEPSNLGLNPEMVDLQRRASIASRGIAGNEGTFRDQSAQDYYKNLFLRSFINDKGGAGQFNDILPIELQYMRQVMGLDTGYDSESIMRAMGFPGQSVNVPQPGAPGATPNSGFGIANPISSTNRIREEQGGERQTATEALDTVGYGITGPLSDFDKKTLTAIGAVPGMGFGTAIPMLANALGITGVTSQPNDYATMTLREANQTASLANDETFMNNVNQTMESNPDIFGGSDVPAAGSITPTIAPAPAPAPTTTVDWSGADTSGGTDYQGTSVADGGSGLRDEIGTRDGSYDGSDGGATGGTGGAAETGGGLGGAGDLMNDDTAAGDEGGDSGGRSGDGGDRHGGFHKGGQIPESRVPGKTGANTKEILQEGEYVIRKEVVDKLGPGFFDAINKAFAPK